MSVPLDEGITSVLSAESPQCVSVLNTEQYERSATADVDDILSAEDEILKHDEVPGYDSLSILDTLDSSMFDHASLYPTATNESIIRFTDTVMKSSTKRSLISATLTALIVELTSPKSIDYQFLLDFFLTYRMFLQTDTLAEILMARFLWAFKLTVTNKQGTDPATVENGKLVLIRTFVTIRHWLLNYFQDDFINDTALKTTFVSFVNELSDYSTSVSQRATDEQRANIEIGTRILLELKKVYINLCSIYWSTIPLEHIKPDELLTYPLNAYEHMNSTRLSTMGLQQTYDPSFRNSGILSLYNSNSNSATNLLLQKHTENKSKNLATFLHNNNKAKQRPFKIFADNDIHFLHPKDSLTSLKKASTRQPIGANNRQQHDPRTPLKPSLTNIIRDEVKYTPLDGVKRLSKDEIAEQLAMRDQGFITNGNIGVFTDSKIRSIVPVTPEKLKQAPPKQPQQKHQHQHQKPASSKPSKEDSTQKRVSFQENRNQNSHKGGITKIVHSWRRRFQKQKIENNDLRPLIENVSKIIDPVSASTVNRVNSQSTLTGAKSSKEKDSKGTGEANLDTRVDVLSARIIEEFQYLLNDQGFKSNLSKQLLNEPRRRQSVFSLATIMRDNKTDDGEEYEDAEDDDEMFHENTFTMSPTKKFNDRNSFKAPSVSFNWTDSFNNTTNDSTGKVDAVDNIVPSMIEDLKILGASENAPNDEVGDEQFVPAEPVFHDREYDDETPMVPFQSARQSAYSAKSYISYDSRLSQDDYALQHQKLETDNDAVSAKSYLSYDSALSAQLHMTNLDQTRGDASEIHGLTLKKKTSFKNLKDKSPVNAELPKSESTYMEISLDKEEHNNLITLKALPFCVTNVSRSTTSVIKRESSSFFEIKKQFRLSVRDDQVNVIPHSSTGISIHSLDDGSSDEEISIADFESTLSKIEGEDEDHVEPEDELERFGSQFETESRVSMIPSIHSSVIMPFPGLDSAAIAELAAIPDDSFNDDPIAAALMKLEGKYVKNATEASAGRVFYGLNDEASQEDESMGNSSIDELKLESKVRDLFITTNPGLPNPIIEKSIMSRKSRHLAEMNMVSSTPHKPEMEDDDEDLSSIAFFNQVGAADETADDHEVNEDAPLTTLEKIIDSNTHVSLILSYDSERLARQLTVIEKDALLEIDWKELIELRWQQTVEPINSWLELLLDENKRKGVNLVISRFNLMINWLISEILLTGDLQERKQIITRCIHIAQHCKALQNYSTVMQIILALTSAKVSKLTKTWQAMNSEDVANLKDLEKLASPFKNFANLRNENNKIVPSKGCIPFLGLYLSDLTFNAERPNFFKRDNPNDSTTSLDRSLIDDYSESSKLINFAKFRTSATVVRSLIQCIEWSKLYSIKVETEIVSKCLYIKSLTDEEMNVCTARIKE